MRWVSRWWPRAWRPNSSWTRSGPSAATSPRGSSSRGRSRPRTSSLPSVCRSAPETSGRSPRAPPTPSGRRDLNPRPPAPKAGALPSCATSRYLCSRHLRPDLAMRPGSAGPTQVPWPQRQERTCIPPTVVVVVRRGGPRGSVTPMPTVRVAVFDLGSNSFHLMVVDASRNGVLIPVLRRRSFLHLGTEVARTGAVPGDRAASAVRTVRRLRTAADEAGVDVVVALATAALRDATNGQKLLGRLERVIGCLLYTSPSPRDRTRS